MDKQKLIATVSKLRKFKRLFTELHKLIPLLDNDQDIRKVKSVAVVIEELLQDAEKGLVFECEECHSKVESGRCLGCKKNYLK